MLALLLAIAVSGAALPPRQAGTPTLPAGAGPRCTNVSGQNPGNLAGTGSHKQFALGCCLSDADCQTGCCGKLTGVCQNLGVATLPAIGGCGGVFGSGAAQTSSPASSQGSPDATTTASSPKSTNPESQPSTAPVEGTSPCNPSQDPGNLAGKARSTQFITGCCDSDADCKSGCCGKNNGVCQARRVAEDSAKIGGCGGQFTSKKMVFKTF